MKSIDIKSEIIKLKHGEKFIIPESDYGKAEVWFINDIYVLFEIPYMGGDPIFNDTYTKGQIGMLIDNVLSWQ